MTIEQFKSLWTTRYSKTIPISHSFRHDYNDRWFRIHSLPESKRYPDNDAEWRILLSRQNSIITDILGENSKIIIVTGQYHHEVLEELDATSDITSINQFSFVYLDSIDLHKLRPKEHELGETYKPMFCEAVWYKDNFDNVLRDIAQDNVRVFFVSLDHDTVVAPYGGGIDFILKDSVTRDKYKTKYGDWLSDREDGL
jgi:hypothetical protein